MAGLMLVNYWPKLAHSEKHPPCRPIDQRRPNNGQTVSCSDTLQISSLLFAYQPYHSTNYQR